jgi:hypothetical protein
MDSVTKALLQDIVRREGRSLLQYVFEAFPWTGASERNALGKIETIVKEEQQGAAALISLLFKKHMTPPYLGAYPMTFTNLNYISLDHLLPLLIEYQRQRVGDLETYLTRIADRDAVAVVRQILDYKRRHLQTLIDMHGTQTPTAAA